MDDEEDTPLGLWVWEGIAQETTPGTAPLSSMVPKLWEPLVLKSLTTQTPAWPREPAKPLTFRQRVRLRWYRLLDRWPLQWKRDDDEGDWD